jgi:hypothetical protein
MCSTTKQEVEVLIFLAEMKRELLCSLVGQRENTERQWTTGSSTVMKTSLLLAAGESHSRGSLIEAFEIEVFVSGFAYKPRTLESATRAQRAFLRLAKGENTGMSVAIWTEPSS